MPKPHTFPTLYNEVLQLNISKLKQWGYLKTGQTVSSTITWSRNGNTTGEISIHLNTIGEQPYIELDYNFKGEPRNYKVNLISTPSNLNSGLVWYFVCPETNKRCRKLYSIGGHFLHREAFNGCMYESQTQSKKNRAFEKSIGVIFRTDDLYSQLYKKNFKKTYAGKPTKKYLRILRKIQQAESITAEKIEQALML